MSLLSAWNRDRGVWETPRRSILCDHKEPFTENWPVAGKARHGVAYARPVFMDHRPPVTLPTPNAYTLKRGGSSHPDRKRAGGHQINLDDVVEHVLLPTPKAADGQFDTPSTTGRPASRATHLATRVAHQMGQLEHRDGVGPLLPTPTTVDAKDNVDVANQIATRNSLGLPCISAILGYPPETWPSTDLRNTKKTGEGERRRRSRPQHSTTETAETLF